MDADVRQTLLLLGNKLASLEEKIDTLTDKIEELKEDIPPDLDEDISEIKAMLMQNG